MTNFDLRAFGVALSVATASAMVGIGLGLAVSGQPVCDVSILPDGTWMTRTTIADCEMPTWGVFSDDGTWEPIEPNL